MTKPLIWTNERPTAFGLYRVRGGSLSANQAVTVIIDDLGQLYAYSTFTCGAYSLNRVVFDGLQWCGPLPEGKEE